MTRPVHRPHRRCVRTHGFPQPLANRSIICSNSSSRAHRAQRRVPERDWNLLMKREDPHMSSVIYTALIGSVLWYQAVPVFSCEVVGHLATESVGWARATNAHPSRPVFCVNRSTVAAPLRRAFAGHAAQPSLVPRPGLTARRRSKRSEDARSCAAQASGVDAQTFMQLRWPIMPSQRNDPPKELPAGREGPRLRHSAQRSASRDRISLPIPRRAAGAFTTTDSQRSKQQRQRRLFAAIADWALLGAACTGIVTLQQRQRSRKFGRCINNDGQPGRRRRHLSRGQHGPAAHRGTAAADCTDSAT